MEKEIFLAEGNKKIFKPELRKVQRPNWTTSQFRDVNKLWLDKNENSDKLLLKETKKLFNQIKVPAIFSYPDLSRLYKKLAKNLKESLIRTSVPNSRMRNKKPKSLTEPQLENN